MRMALKLGIRIWVFCSHQCTKHRHEAPVPLALLQCVPWPTPSCQGAQDPQHERRDLLSAPGRPPADVAKWWVWSTSQGTPEAQDKGGHQAGYTQPFSWISYVRQSTASVLCLTHPTALTTPYGHWMESDSLQTRQWTVLCTVLWNLQKNLHLPRAA